MPITTSIQFINKFLTIKEGFIGLHALENGRITAKQLEAVRKVLVRKLKKQGKIWFMVFPHHPVSAKAGEVRMGRGKGKVKHWVARVARGQLLLTVGGVAVLQGKEALQYSKKKLPIASKIIGPIV